MVTVLVEVLVSVVVSVLVEVDVEVARVIASVDGAKGSEIATCTAVFIALLKIRNCKV